MCPRDRRLPLWDRLARELPQAQLESMIRPASLEDVPSLARDILAGNVRGRVVVSLI
jgi:acrylyl-CoA reductase (NADPH)